MYVDVYICVYIDIYSIAFYAAKSAYMSQFRRNVVGVLKETCFLNINLPFFFMAGFLMRGWTWRIHFTITWQQG